MCLTPIVIKKKNTKDSIPVPCGSCPECRARRASAWSFRLMQEYKVSENAHFITLTYDTNHVPISKNGFMDLSRRDLQLFFKRLRKSVSSKISVLQKANGSRIGASRPIRYYAVGEYGGRTKRPHYHIILFNAELKHIQPAWNLGSVHYGEVTIASVGYTLKYISKPGQIPMHRNDDRTREFSLMSKGLGLNYVTEKIKNWHNKAPERMYLTTEDNKKICMPRYYKEKIYHPEKQKAFGAIARIEAIKKQEKHINADPEYFRRKAENDLLQFRKQKLPKGDKL